MLFRTTPGPGGFGHGFGHPGITPVPAKTSPVPGVYSGPSAVLPQSHPWLWVALIVLIVLAVAITITVSRGRP
jgi:hypothetical protein